MPKTKQMLKADALQKAKESITGLANSDALEPAKPNASSFFNPESHIKDAKAFRKKIALLALLIIIAFVASLGIGVTSDELYGPSDVLLALSVWGKTTFESVTGVASYTVVDLMEMCPCYFQVMTRISITFMALMTGVLVTLAGMVYQGVFRNPVAAPTMLGVASGLNMGLLVFVMIYGAAATYMTMAHYAFAYGGAIIALIAVLFISRLINGSKRFSVVDMLLVGSIFSQVVGQIVLYVTYYVFSDEGFMTYTTLNEVLSVDTSMFAFMTLFIVFIITFVPIYLMRFRLNVLSFTEEEALGMGVKGNAFRYATLAFATIMVIAAMAHGGMVGMVALVAPFVSRAAFGAEFSKQTVGNVLVGALMVVVCRGIADLLSIYLHFQGFVFNFPIGVVASLISLPLFIWIIALQQRTWD